MIYIFASVVLLLSATRVSSWCSNTSTYVTNDVMIDDFVEAWRSSGLGVVLSAPHGGTLRPESIPKREAGCWDHQDAKCIWRHGCGDKDMTRCMAENNIDDHTAEMTREIRENLCCYFKGLCPTTIISLLARDRHDPNREEEEATFDVQMAIESYETYHNLIAASSANMAADNPTKGGVLFDIHGHSHPEHRVELGYLFTGRQLDMSDSLQPRLSSIYSLANRSHDFERVLRGKASYGAYLDNYGYASVPSPNISGPGGAIYFNGGYTVRRHGSRDGGSVDAIQIESAKSFRVDRKRHACALAFAIAEFYCEHYTNGTMPLCLDHSENQRMFKLCTSSAYSRFQLGWPLLLSAIVGLYLRI